MKVNLAIDRLPEFTAAPGFDPEVHGGTIVLAPSLDHVENAFQDAVAGRPAALPFADICIPSVFDRTLAPEGKHVMSMFTQWVPHEWSARAAPRRARRVRRPRHRRGRGGRARLPRLDPAPPGDRPLRHGAHLRADRREHLPRRAVAGAAVPHAARARLRRLPHARSGTSTRRRPRPTAAAASPASPGSRSSSRSAHDRQRPLPLARLRPPAPDPPPHPFVPKPVTTTSTGRDAASVVRRWRRRPRSSASSAV